MAPRRCSRSQLADNPDAWLDFTDLVFVDPVATGYSRSAAGTDEADKAFFGVEKDADAMADFVRLTLTRAGRTLAPVFLAGESYGGFRVALLADRLLGSGIAVRGVGDDLAGAGILHAARQSLRRSLPAGAGAALDRRHASGAARRRGRLARRSCRRSSASRARAISCTWRRA